MATKGRCVFALLNILFSIVIRAQSQLICELGCCRAIPTCEEASSIECSCQHCDQIFLKSGSIPESTKSLHISGSANLTVDRDILFNQPKLVNFTVSNVTMLTLREHSLKLPDGAHFSSLNVESAETVHIFDDAFSGNWCHSIHVKLKNIGTLNIQKEAFTYTSSSLGPSLTLENVRTLFLSPGTFSAPISLLKLKNVSLTTCSTGTFGTQIHHLELHYVNITEVMPRSFEGRDDFEILSICSCHLEKVHPRAFTGSLRSMTIEDSTISTVPLNGFQINVTNFRLANSYLGEVSPKGMCILARSGLRLDNVFIGKLMEQALVGIRVIGSKPGSRPPVVIRNLHVRRAENGSLTFGKCTKLSLSGLHVEEMWPRICPTEKWARQLVDAQTADKFSETEFAVYHALRRRRMCPDDRYKPFPDADDSCELDDAAPQCLTESKNFDEEASSPPGGQSFEVIYKSSIDSFAARKCSPAELVSAGKAMVTDDLHDTGDSNKREADVSMKREADGGASAKASQSNSNTALVFAILILAVAVAIIVAIIYRKRQLLTI